MLANGFNNDGLPTAATATDQRQKRRCCRDAFVERPVYSDSDRLWWWSRFLSKDGARAGLCFVSVPKWMERGCVTYDGHRGDGMESLLFMGDHHPSVSQILSPGFGALDEGIGTKPMEMEYEIKSNGGGGDAMTIDRMYGLKLDVVSGRSDSDGSSFGVESEINHHQQANKNSIAAPTMAQLNRMHSDSLVNGSLFFGMEGACSGPSFFAQDSGSSYRSTDVYMEGVRDPMSYSRCIADDYSHPPVKLERALGSTAGTRNPFASVQSSGWLAPHSHMQLTQRFLQDPRQLMILENGNANDSSWPVYRSTSCPSHLQPTIDEALNSSAQLSRQLHVYPGRPLESLEAEPDMSSSGKRRASRKRENLPKESTAVLKQWLLSHLLMPYPVNEEKMTLCSTTGLDLSQINNWFINARVRIWKPLVSRVFKEFKKPLQDQAQANGDPILAKRIGDGDKSTTMGMITLLSSLPEARKALDKAAKDSVSTLLSQ